MLATRPIPQELVQQGYSQKVAYALSKFSANAYENASTLAEIYRESVWQFEEDNFFEDDFTSTRGFVVTNSSTNALEQSVSTTVLSFRGSENILGVLFPYSDGWINWIQTDANLKLVPLSPQKPGVEVARGFKGAWDNIKEQAISRLDILLGDSNRADVKNLFITGHSLGAALAILSSVQLNQLFPRVNIYVYTYATPVLGNQAFVDLYDSLIHQTFGRTFQNQNFLISNDPIRLVGHFQNQLSNYVRLNNHEILPVAYSFNPHSILNYMPLLSSSTEKTSTSAQAKAIKPLVLRSSSPFHQPSSFLAETPVSRVILRTYTTQGFDKRQDIGSIYFYNRVLEDGSGGSAFKLSKSNHSQPFQSGFIDTFELSDSDLTFADFTRCKLERNSGSNLDARWGLQGVQILLDGVELYNNSEVFTKFNAPNQEFYFSGISKNKVAIGIDWTLDNGTPYDSSGDAPVCAMDSSGNVVEVHKGKHSNKLYYRRGTLQTNGAMIWDTSSHVYEERGETPWVTMNDDGIVVAVHKGVDKDNQFYYRVGQLDSNLSIHWFTSYAYDSSGLNPTVSMRDDEIVEVHKGKNSNKLYYRLGRLNFDGESINWGYDSFAYDSSGENPSVALTADRRVVEVHKGANSNKLFYRVGHVFMLSDISDSSITWDRNSHEYDTSGTRPTVAVDRFGKVLELHKGANTDKLHSRIGTLGNNFDVVWASSSRQYDSSGQYPVVAINNPGQVIEVHKGANSNKLYYRTGKWIEHPFNMT